MPVIINEMEIVSEPPSAPTVPAAQTSAVDGATGQLRPMDLERIVVHMQARRLRVHAD